MKRITIISLGLFSLLTASIPAKSAEIALDFTGTVVNSFLAELTFGWSFQANQSIIVDGLGFFDDEIRTGPDLHQDHLVSLWNSAGVLLAQTTITNASVAVASTAAGGEWLFNDITPVTLSAGEYVIGAHDPVCTSILDCDDIRFLDNAITSSLITFIEARNINGNGFPTASIPERNDGYFGPNLRITAIPIPAALPLMLMGLAGLGFFGWKRN
jgi:hypothetical protein